VKNHGTSADGLLQIQSLERDREERRNKSKKKFFFYNYYLFWFFLICRAAVSHDRTNMRPFLAQNLISEAGREKF
jgi:hypothetical protein